jgi:DNA polymerase III epsilon subunit-like protein
MREIVIDRETTALEPLDRHSIVEIGAVERAWRKRFRHSLKDQRATLLHDHLRCPEILCHIAQCSEDTSITE